MSGTGKTLQDVAREAGVSVMAVSLALRGKEGIGEETRRMILEVARRLNYAPNRFAQGLRTGKSNMIGILVNDPANLFHARMIRSMEEFFRAQGFEVFFAGSNYDGALERAALLRFIDFRVCGVILCASEKNPDSFNLLEQAHIPCVAIDSVPENFDGYAVVNDLDQCGSLAIDYFVEKNARTLLYFDAPDELNYHSAFARIRHSLLAAAKQAGISLSILPGGMTIEQGTQAFQNFHSTHPVLPHGIFCVNDLCALGVIEAAAQCHLSHHHDFTLLGIDNLDISSLSPISLSSISQDYLAMARIASSSLLQLINHKIPTQKQQKIKQTLFKRP